MRKISVRDVKKWENKAIDLWNKVYVHYDDEAPEISKEEAQKLQNEIYSDGISYDYGNYSIFDEDELYEQLSQYYSKAALEYMAFEYDRDLTYMGMRYMLKKAYFVGDDDDYFDIVE